VAIATAIVSIASGRPVSPDVAMTGEITLTGQVLQIGGVREKSLAAQRAGVKRVVLPRDNEPDLVDIPDEVRSELEFVLADEVEQVLEAAFDAALPARPRPAAALPGRKAASAA
jgi:ATP-dependent Lon protease